MRERDKSAFPCLYDQSNEQRFLIDEGLTRYQYAVIEMMKAIRASASGSLGNGVPSDQVFAAAVKDADTAWDAFEKADAPPVAPDESAG